MSTAGGASQRTVRSHNFGLVLSELGSGPASRAELAQRTGLAKATVSSLVDALMAQGILAEGVAASSGVGRPSRPVALNPAGPVALGIEVNVDYTAACVVDLTGCVRRYQLVAEDNRGASVTRIARRALRQARRVQRKLSQPVLGLGVAVPGVVSPDGTLLRAPNLPQLAGVRVGQTVADLVGHQLVVVDNEANLGALAALRHRPIADRDFVYVSGDIGVGAGLVVNGELFRGVNGYAGELGHVVIERNGVPCGCGGEGCLEQYAGLEALLHSAGQASFDALQVALDRADRKALTAVERAGSALGVGLASLLNIVDLPAVVLGGIYGQLANAMKPSLLGELQRRALSFPVAGVRVSSSPFGLDAAVRGAAGSVLDRVLRNPVGLVSPARSQESM
jgi:predicted NBD/HSP70 family sugar kinase